MPKYPEGSQIRIFSIKLGLDPQIRSFSIEIEYHISARIKPGLEAQFQTMPITNGVLTLPLRYAAQGDRLAFEVFNIGMSELEKKVYEEASGCFASLIDCAEQMVKLHLDGDFVINPQNAFLLEEEGGEEDTSQMELPLKEPVGVDTVEESIAYAEDLEEEDDDDDDDDEEEGESL